MPNNSEYFEGNTDKFIRIIYQGSVASTFGILGVGFIQRAAQEVFHSKESIVNLVNDSVGGLGFPSYLTLQVAAPLLMLSAFSTLGYVSTKGTGMFIREWSRKHSESKKKKSLDNLA